MPKQVKKIGRRTKLTKAIKEKLLSNIKMGLPIKESCSLAGIVRQTYYNWIEKAEKGNREFLDFLDTLEAAEAEAQAILVQKLNNDGNPTSWQFILERRWSDNWGRKDKLKTEISGGDKPISINQNLSPEAMKDISDTMINDLRRSSEE